jgi:microcystin-dependent protein
MVGYLTPDETPDTSMCRALFIPANEQYIAIVRGALQELTFPSSWTKFGLLTPDEAAANFMDMFDKFCFDEGICRMIGEVVTWAGVAAPSDQWLECDGASYLRADFPDLFAVIGTTYGAADGTHFNVPDLRGRVTLGAGTGPGLSTYALGQTLGEETHQLTVTELASHNHSTGNSILLGTVTPPPLDALGPNPLPAFTGNTGGDTPHNNIQPSIALSFWIVAVG